MVKFSAWPLSTILSFNLRRWLKHNTKFESTSGFVEFLSGNSATSNVDFATNASTLTIAGQGGTSTIRNNLRVNATSRFDADVTLCGGYASYSFIIVLSTIGIIRCLLKW
jgi:uncharacterized protein YhdP